ncbi:MAG: sigma-70 family RNA polymerase sigma factor [Bacteroidota bacterium]|nr:sigma-70 family RNA polymerase sigma factor [Bacteroidota bacterium]
MRKISDEAIVEGIKLKSVLILKHFYKTRFPAVKKMVIKNSGDEFEAEDVFQEGILAIYDKVRKGKYIDMNAFDAFFFVICRRIWLNKLGRQKSKEVLTPKFHEYSLGLEDNIVEGLIDEDFLRNGLYHHYFLELSEQCQELLRLYSRKASYKEIADEMGFKSAGYAKARKFDCKEFLKRKITSDQEYKNYYEDEE